MLPASDFAQGIQQRPVVLVQQHEGGTRERSVSATCPEALARHSVAVSAAKARS
jgi:hypothetical protein